MKQSYHIMSISSYDISITSYPIISYQLEITSNPIISYHIISYQIISYHKSNHFISYHMISYHIMSYDIISYHVNHFISYINHLISYHINHINHFMSCHVMSCHIASFMPCHITSYHRYFNRHCSQEIRDIIPVPLRRVRATRTSTQSHLLQVSLPNPQTLSHKSSLIPRHAIYGTPCLLLAFLNLTTCHLLNLRPINLT